MTLEERIREILKSHVNVKYDVPYDVITSTKAILAAVREAGYVRVAPGEERITKLKETLCKLCEGREYGFDCTKCADIRQFEEKLRAAFAGYVRVVDNQKLPPVPNYEVAHIVMERDRSLLTPVPQGDGTETVWMKVIKPKEAKHD